MIFVAFQTVLVYIIGGGGGGDYKFNGQRLFTCFAMRQGTLNEELLKTWITSLEKLIVNCV